MSLLETGLPIYEMGMVVLLDGFLVTRYTGVDK